MRRSNDDRLIMMVAQQPFASESNQFCKLLPVAYLDGARPGPDDFPNDGEVWWMLTTQSAPLAEPGHLVIGSTEDAYRYAEDDPTSSRYQAVREEVRTLDLKVGLEVIEIPGDRIDSIQALASSGFRLELSHRPTPQALVRWRSEVYGPFRTISTPLGSGDGRVNVSFTPLNLDLTVFRMPVEQFRSSARSFLLSISEDISPSSTRRLEAYRLLTVKYELLLGPGYEKVLAQKPATLVLESVEQKLNRFAKQCLGRKKRQELRRLLEELELTGREMQQSEDLIQIAATFSKNLEVQDATLTVVADAILGTGMLGEERIQQAEKIYADRYVQERTAAIQSQIEESVAARREELRRIEGELKTAQTRQQQEAEAHRAQLQQELAEKRQQAEASIRAEREDLDRQKEDLEYQQLALQENLEKVTTDLRKAGDEVVNRFLTIAPLLGAAGFGVARPAANGGTPSDSGGKPAKAERLQMPAYVTRSSAVPPAPLTEQAFFERFTRLVEQCGFQYRPVDLIRFHLSMKVGVLTVLGGPSGIGKSSLPLLYSRALVGEELENGRPDCLMINVNPSWMDVRDILGHLNTLEGRFYPAETGLFRQVAFAQEELTTRGRSSGLYLTCLDEMNLSQVEHYFSDLMMVLEREGEQRRLQCFTPDVVSDACPFRDWSTIRLSPALRFVGTVNFDETTRALSDRFLDRVNLIQLSAGTLPSASGSGPLAKADGRMVTLADFEDWQGSEGLPSDLAELLDKMRPFFQNLGCPISPRVYRAICRFVGSSQPFLSAPKAFDVQITQRVLPRIRSLVTRRQLDALDGVQRLLNETNSCSFEMALPLLEEIRESSAIRDWVMED